MAQPTPIRKVTEEYAPGSQPSKHVGVKEHIRRGVSSGARKMGSAIAKTVKKKRGTDVPLPPELLRMATDADELAAILERLE